MNITKFLETFDDCKLEGDKIVVKDRLHDAILISKTDYSFDILKDITAVDRGDTGIELTYHLYSTVNEEDLLISVFAKDEAESISDIFNSAIADECEIYDMFGINFPNNKHLKRLYMPESWDGFPLRKDYIEKDERLAWNDDNNA